MCVFFIWNCILTGNGVGLNGAFQETNHSSRETALAQKNISLLIETLVECVTLQSSAEHTLEAQPPTVG